MNPQLYGAFADQARNKHPDTIRVTNYLEGVGEAGRTVHQISDVTGLNNYKVKQAIARLQATQKISSKTVEGKKRYLLKKFAPKPKDTKPEKFGPGTTGHEPYLCPELRPNPGVTADRFEAYRLPSIVHGVRVYPKSRV